MKKQNLFILFQVVIVLSFKAQVMDPNKAPQNNNSAEVKFPESSAFVNSNVTYKIISAAANTFCYDIFSDGKLLIHQPSVPGMPGNKGFKDKGSAEKVANLVIKKIKNGEMPPTVTTEELKKLKANF